MDDSEWFGEHPKPSIVRAGAWATAANVGNAALTLIGTVILSRLLDPADVGLFALAFSFYSIPSLIVGPGLTAAAVQAPHLTRHQSSNLFWINVAANTAMAALLVAISPYLAGWFHQPALRTLCPVFALVLILEAFATQYRALLTRTMRFDLVAKIGFLTGLGSLIVAIVLATLGLGMWALVIQVIVAAVADRIALATVVPWRPSLFDHRISVRELVHFSGASSLSLAMHMVYSQSQSLLMGRFASVDNVGYYTRGQALFQKPFAQIIGPLHAVLLPALSSRQRDPALLGGAVYRANSVLYSLLPPLVIWLMISGTDIVVVLLGKAWEPAGRALFWFAAAAIPGILFSTLYKSNDAIGKPAWGLVIRASFLPILITGLVWAAPHGAEAMAAVGAAVEWASAPLIFLRLVKNGPVPPRFFARSMAECIAAMLVIALLMLPIHSWIDRTGLPAIWRASLSLCACYATGLLVVGLFPFGRAAWHELHELTRRCFCRTVTTTTC